MKKSLIDMLDKSLLKKEKDDVRYENSVFYNLKKMLPKQKGKRYELITEDILRKLGFEVDQPTNTDHDRIVNGVKVEMKGSTLNKGTNVFSFLQIRPAQDYESLMFSMFYPDKLVIMTLPKHKINEQVKKGVFKNQHGGKKGKSGTYAYYGNEETLLKIGAEYIV